jgi:peptide methionine sulfoxide reductase msrA/msrB
MSNNYNKLTKEEEYIIEHKGTEAPHSGIYNDFYEDGIFTCKRCGAPLYSSKDKFNSGCGWPSFDDELPNAIKRNIDKDGQRVEIVCANCGGHLGHVFEGERITEKNTRHCVNSLSIKFIPKSEEKVSYAYFAGGCFWGVEYFFNKTKGVIEAISGFMGGRLENPTYQDVCYENTGHLEVVQVKYDASQVSYEELAKLFFEIHNPEQKNGQGPDIGSQYLSAVFVSSEDERKIIKDLIARLESKGYKIATKVLDAERFYEAESYHQHYYEKTGKIPYCHVHKKRF